jgi:hypothetical protein
MEQKTGGDCEGDLESPKEENGDVRKQRFQVSCFTSTWVRQSSPEWLVLTPLVPVPNIYIVI